MLINLTLLPGVYMHDIVNEHKLYEMYEMWKPSWNAKFEWFVRFEQTVDNLKFVKKNTALRFK